MFIDHPPASSYLTVRESGAGYCVAAAAAAAAAEVATEPRGTETGWEPAAEIALVPYSIRIPGPVGTVDCPRCQSSFLAAGPTGYAGEVPICDLCLLDGSYPLGMLLALVVVVRTFGAIEPAAGDKYLEAQDHLAAFARIYERVAAKSGPVRPFRLPDPEA